MRYILLVLSVLFFSIAAAAQSPAEQVILQDDKVACAYRLLNTPEQLRLEHCDTYIFSDSRFSPLANGLYKSKSGNKFLVEQNCLFAATGTALLMDGRAAYFFIQDTFNTNGHVMYFCEDTACTGAADGKYILSTGQEFQIEKGAITDYGFFNSGKIHYEDRN